jgi:hypothetical protein
MSCTVDKAIPLLSLSNQLHSVIVLHSTRQRKWVVLSLGEIIPKTQIAKDVFRVITILGIYFSIIFAIPFRRSNL